MRIETFNINGILNLVLTVNMEFIGKEVFYGIENEISNAIYNKDDWTIDLFAIVSTVNNTDYENCSYQLW